MKKQEQKITFTNYFNVDGKKAAFEDLTKEQKIFAGNWARRVPLETLFPGRVVEVSDK